MISEILDYEVVQSNHKSDGNLNTVFPEKLRLVFQSSYKDVFNFKNHSKTSESKNDTSVTLFTAENC